MGWLIQVIQKLIKLIPKYELDYRLEKIKLD